MKEIAFEEMRRFNGGARYVCTTRVWKTHQYTLAGQAYQGWAKCGHVSYSKAAMGYHFLFAHGGGSGCTYYVK